MGWTDDEGSVFYGVADYEKARKILDNPNTYKLLRDRIDPMQCGLGKPVMWWFDGEWKIQTDRLKDYLDTWDVVQEHNIDAILDFMPDQYTQVVVHEGWGTPGDEGYWEGCTHDSRETNKEELLEIWAHPKGFLGYLEDQVAMYTEPTCTIAEAKAFNRLCRTQDTENTNNSIIAEHILAEGLEPPSDSDYKAALERLNNALDTDSTLDCYSQTVLPDYREMKGLIQPPVASAPAPAPQAEAPAPVAEAETEKLSGLCFTEWADSKMNPLKTTNPPLYYVLYVLLSPVMIPIALIEAFLQGLFGGPKKRQWYQQDDDGNWIPVVYDEVTGEIVPGEGLS